MKRTLLFLFLTALLGMVSVAWGAVITVGASGCDYTTVKAAINAAASGDELILYSDFVIDSGDYMYPNTYALMVTEKSISIDLNSYSISSNAYGSTIHIVHDGELLIKDSSDGVPGSIINTDGEAVGNYGAFTMNAGVLNGSYCALYNYNDFEYSPNDIHYGTVIINGGTLTGGDWGVLNCGILTISGGSFHGGSGYDIDNSGKLTITTDLTINKLLLRGGADAAGVTDAGTLITETDVKLLMFLTPKSLINLVY